MEVSLCKVRDILRSINDFEIIFHARHGIGLNEGMLLCTIAKQGQCCSGNAAEKLGITPSNASKVIASVEKKGLVKRVLCPDDKRRMLFVLTPEGERLLATVKCNSEEVAATIENIKSLLI